MGFRWKKSLNWLKSKQIIKICLDVTSRIKENIKDCSLYNIFTIFDSILELKHSFRLFEAMWPFSTSQKAEILV